MVSFTCNRCQDVVKKPKVQNHFNTCGSHSFTCVDCMHVFDLDSIKAHTSCVTEEDKYQGKWKQKLSTNAHSSGEAPRGIERPPRAPMNDLSSSDESDDDWAGKGSAKKKATKTAAAAAAPAPVSRRKNPRPGVSPSSDDDDDDHHHNVSAVHAKKAAVAMTPPAKKAKTTAATTATTRSPRSSSLGPRKAAVAVEGAEADGDAPHPGKKDTPLLLPRSTVSTDCVVPSFVLGTSAEVAEIVREVLAENGVAAMRGKELSLALVDRYAKRIAKSVRHAVDAAVELHSLKVDAKGNIALA